MKILKVINNNVVSAYNDNGKEIVVMGKGIGFQKKQNDNIDETKIEKTYHLGHENTGIYEDIVKDIPYEYVQVASKIISHARRCLNKELSKNIYITLTDHMNYAITRAKQNVMVENALLWEIKRYYQQEYQIGRDAIDMIQEDLGIRLSEDEAGFFALHIVNAEIGADMSQTAKMPDILKDIVNIVSYTMGVDMDENSLYYERFITHLKFFLERVVKKQPFTEGGYELNDMVRGSYPESYRCAVRIKTYIRARLQYEVYDEELTYLTIHIHNIVRQK